MRDSKVTVIIPVYNVEPYLDACINSVLVQSHRNLEVILIDDGSTDNSLEICKKFELKDSRVRVIHKANGGVSSARNVGLRNYSGEYLMFLDSDDEYQEDIIERAIEKIEMEQSDLLVFGVEKRFSDNSCDRTVYCGDQYNIDGEIVKLLHNFSSLGGGYPNKVWKVSPHMKEIPLFNEDLIYFEDSEWVVRMLLITEKISYLDEVGYIYKIRKNSVTFSEDNYSKKVLGYHQAMGAIIDDLAGNKKIKTWFEKKYYAELVNGIIDAIIKKQADLLIGLYGLLDKSINNMKLGTTISFKIKIRLLCIALFRYVSPIQ